MRFLWLGAVLLGTMSAADWLQWGGPGRDFRLPAGTSTPSWPAAPKQMWSRDLGDGYSSMLMSGNVLYTMYRKGSQDIVIALDAATGKTAWETAIDAPHRQGMNVEAGPGPHSTPLIVGDKIFATSVIGQLVALNRSTGKKVWSRELWSEL